MRLCGLARSVVAHASQGVGEVVNCEQVKQCERVLNGAGGSRDGLRLIERLIADAMRSGWLQIARPL